MLEGQRVIDVHHHFLPRTVFDELKAEAGGAMLLPETGPRKRRRRRRKKRPAAAAPEAA